MKPVTRRSIMVGSAAAMTAIPAVGLCKGATEAPADRVSRLTTELEDAMRELYGSEVETLSYDKSEGMRPLVMVVAHVE